MVQKQTAYVVQALYAKVEPAMRCFLSEKNSRIFEGKNFDTHERRFPRHEVSALLSRFREKITRATKEYWTELESAFAAASAVADPGDESPFLHESNYST